MTLGTPTALLGRPSTRKAASWNLCQISRPLPDDDLKNLIDDLTRQENEVSYQRRLLHGKIDILRAELVARLQKTGGKSVLDQVDVDHLTDILTAKAAPPG